MDAYIEAYLVSTLYIYSYMDMEVGGMSDNGHAAYICDRASATSLASGGGQHSAVTSTSVPGAMPQ